MQHSYYQFTEAERAEIRAFFATFSLSVLLAKSAYNGTTQSVTHAGTLVNIEVSAGRLYPNMMPHRTNILGAISTNITNGTLTAVYTLPELQYLTGWQFEQRLFRIVIPNEILSEIQIFIQTAIERDLDIISTQSEQIVYYTEDMGEAEYLRSLYPVIIIETKEE